jgi:hypothetical protein
MDDNRKGRKKRDSLKMFCFAKHLQKLQTSSSTNETILGDIDKVSVTI